MHAPDLPDPHPPHQTPPLQREVDVGSGETSPGQKDTEKMIEEVGKTRNPERDRASTPTSPDQGEKR